jgi:tyrosyl-tRNA synthetase
MLEVGGDDQWSNMLAGVDLIRRKEQKDAFCLTCTLLLNSEGKKMGKTQKGALWLDENKCSVYDFYQYFRNVEDVKVAECMRLLTFMEMDEIAELTKYTDERINAAKARLAYEVTKLVHGEEKANEARRQAEAAFSGNADDMPSVTITANAETPIVNVIALTGVCSSTSEARRLVEGGGVKINETKPASVKTLLGELTTDKEFVLHKGKKVHIKVVIE